MNKRFDTVLKVGNLSTVLTLDDAEARQETPCIYFRSESDRDAFTARCPKSLRVRPHYLHNIHGNIYGLVGGENNRVAAAGIIIGRTKSYLGETSKVTGEVNETGNKRLAKWYQLIHENCRVLPSFY